MRLDEPRWWYDGGNHPIALILSPLGRIYGWAASARARAVQPYRSQLPVVCIGNLTAGGTGKTPTALYVARLLVSLGQQPAFLTRGYGGTMRGPHLVDPDRDHATEVGDEPLLLARAAPVVVARDRAAGARLIETTPATVIVMDDGLQNPTLAKDLRIALVDSRRGVGNGLVIPAGPLRAPLAHQLTAIDLIGWVDDREPGSQSPLTGLLGADAPIIRLKKTVVSDSSHIAGRRCLAFCGIADPARFFTTVESTGAMLIGRRSFPDHHMFSENDARGLLDEAQRLDAELVTTEKDSVRLPQDDAMLGELKTRSRTIAISMASDRDGESLLLDRLRGTLEHSQLNARSG